MITFLKYTGWSYLLAIVAATGILSLPKVRRTSHKVLWRVFFPALFLCHLTVEWKLFEILFEATETDPVPAYLGIVSAIFMVWNCVGDFLFWVYKLLFSSGLPFDLEVHIPFALNSLAWSLAITALVIYIVDRRRGSHPNKSSNLTGAKNAPPS